MTENDYIAEYIREKYPKLLGMDYTCWKIARSISVSITRVSQTCIDTAERLSDAFKKYNEMQLSTADIEKYDFPTDDDMKQLLRQQSMMMKLRRQQVTKRRSQRMNVRCKVDSCCYCIDGECDLEEITISDNEMTAAGFKPICQDYDEGLISKGAKRLMELSEERADE